MPQQNESLEQQAKNAEEMRENLLIALENAIKLDELEGQKAEKLGQQLELTQRRLDVSTKLLRQTASTLNNMIAQKDSLQQTVASADELKGILDIVSEKQVEGVQAGAKYNKILENMRRINQEAGTDDAKRLQLLRESAKEMEELRAEMEDVKKFGDSFNNSLSGWGSKLGVANNLMSTSSGKIGSMVADLTTGLTTDKIAMVGKAFQEFGITILASVVDEMFKLAIAINTLGKEFQRTNGYAQDFDKTLMNIYKNTLAAGVSTEEAGSAFQSLSDSYSDFNPKAGLQNEYMGTTIGLLTKTGVQAGTSAKSIQMLSKSFQMTGEQATDAFMKITTSGNSAGISNRKMAADFEANFANLVQFGDKAVEVFKDLSAQSKATGVAMNNLVSIAQKFDTFEGAATQSAKLNSILGSNVSALELMNADYADTITLIQDGLSGVNFEELNRFEQQYIATAMGANSVHEAQMLLSGDADEIGAKMEAQAKSQAELRQIVMENLPLMKRLAISISKIALAFEPVIDLMAYMADWFLSVDDFTSGNLIAWGLMLVGWVVWIPGLIGLLSTLVMSFIEVGFSLGAIGAFFKGTAAAVGGSFAAIFTGLLLLQVAFNMLLDSLMPVWSGTKAFFELLAYVGILAAAGLAGLNPITLGIVAFAGAIMFLWRNGKKLLLLLMTKINPPFINAFSWMATGVELLGLAFKVMMAPFNTIIGMFKMAFEAAKPFVGLLNQVGGYLGFDVNTGEEPTTSTVKGTGPQKSAKKPAAAIQQAATEVKTLVVAQLRETGIQETANELAKIAKAMQGEEPVTNVSVNIDGRSLSDFVMRTITG